MNLEKTSFNSMDPNSYWNTPSSKFVQTSSSQMGSIPITIPENTNAQILENRVLTHLNGSQEEVDFRGMFKAIEPKTPQNQKAYQLITAAKKFIFNHSPGIEAFLQGTITESDAQLMERSGLPLCKPGDTLFHVVIRLGEILKKELSESSTNQKPGLLKEYGSFQNGVIDLMKKLYSKSPQTTSSYLNHRNQDQLTFKELHNQSLLKIISPHCTKYDTLTTISELLKFFEQNEGEFIHTANSYAQELAIFKFIDDFFIDAFFINTAKSAKRGDTIISFISHAMAIKEKSSVRNAGSENAMRENLKKFLLIIKDIPNYEDLIIDSLMRNTTQLSGTVVMKDCIKSMFVSESPCSEEDYKVLANRCKSLYVDQGESMVLQTIKWETGNPTILGPVNISFAPGLNIIHVMANFFRKANSRDTAVKAFATQCVFLAQALAATSDCPFKKEADQYAKRWRERYFETPFVQQYFKLNHAVSSITSNVPVWETLYQFVTESYPGLAPNNRKNLISNLEKLKEYAAKLKNNPAAQAYLKEATETLFPFVIQFNREGSDLQDPNYCKLYQLCFSNSQRFKSNSTLVNDYFKHSGKKYFAAFGLTFEIGDTVCKFAIRNFPSLTPEQQRNLFENMDYLIKEAGKITSQETGSFLREALTTWLPYVQKIAAERATAPQNLVSSEGVIATGSEKKRKENDNSLVNKRPLKMPKLESSDDEAESNQPTSS